MFHDRGPMPGLADIPQVEPQGGAFAHHFRSDTDPVIALTLFLGPKETGEARWRRVRQALAEATGSAEEGLAPIRREPKGKPLLAPPQDELGFSVAHRPGMLLIGTARGHRIGVDLEPVDPSRNWQAVARHFFAPSEAHCLAALGSRAGLAAFYGAWVVKEAVLKAVGCGIGTGLAVPRLTDDAIRALAEPSSAGLRLACPSGTVWASRVPASPAAMRLHPELKIAAAALTIDRPDGLALQQLDLA